MVMFLVYEHWRPDTDVCFYVGKGKLKRARSFEVRNPRYGRTVAKLQRLGLVPIIKIVRDGLTESEAFALEISMISYWRGRCASITNCSDGGEGCSGRKISDRERARLRALAKGRKHKPETIAKMIAARTGQRRYEETRLKQSKAAKVAQKARFEKVKQTRKGRDSLKRQMTAMSQAAAADPALRAKRSANAKALWADPVYREKMEQRRCVSRPVVKGFS